MDDSIHSDEDLFQCHIYMTLLLTHKNCQNGSKLEKLE
jgi:hypothetical protein